jgi:uncharacterized RDD family membrane protein YckC
MPSHDTLHNRFGQLSDEALRALLASEETDGLTSADFRALTEELVRRGLRKSTAPSRPLGNVAAGGRRHPKASIARRFIAAAIDSVIVIGGWTLIPPIVLLTSSTKYENAASIPVIILFLSTLCYAFLRDARRGQSLGKRAARLMVISLSTGRPCGARDSAFRSLVLILSGVLIPGIGWLIEPIVALVDKDGRRLGDRAADTQVIELSSYNAA